MNVLFIFIWIFITFSAMAFLEKTIEGPYAWAKKSYGWKIVISKHLSLTEYHLVFFLFLVMWSLLPFVIYGFSLRLFGVLLSAFSLGFIWEDFLYFLINPYFGFRKWNSKDAGWYPWLKIWKFEIPFSYVGGFCIALLSWYFLWRI